MMTTLDNLQPVLAATPATTSIPSSPVVLHLPHSSGIIPADLRRKILLDDKALNQELVRLTDSFTDTLFGLNAPEVERIVFPVSRLIIDPERFENDEKEPMAGRGMGVIYTSTSFKTPLRHPPTLEERNSLLDRFYHPHHQSLTRAVRDRLDHFNRCLVIDAHSFPAEPRDYELDQKPQRKDICLGTDPFHTPADLLEFAAAAFQLAGYTVALNTPYAGTIVPLSYLGKDNRVLSIMVEVNRRLYMNEQTGQPLPEFDAVRQKITQACREIIRSCPTP